MKTEPTIAFACTQKILESFKDYQARFKQITGLAHGRFMKREWVKTQADAIQRLDLYTDTIDSLESDIRHFLGERVGDRQLWEAIITAYSEYLID